MRIRKTFAIALVALVALTPIGASAATTDCGSPYDQAVLSDRPIAYFTLTATPGDCTGRHPIAFHGTPTVATLPNGEQTADFDGASQFAEVPDSDDLSVRTTGALTIEAWLRPDQLEFPNSEATGYVHWLGKGQPDQQEWAARLYSLTNSENRPNRLSGYVFNLSGGLGTGSFAEDPLTTDRWIHFALLITSARSRGYKMGYTALVKDGLWRDQDSLSSYGIRPGNGTAPLRIGTRDLASFFPGAIGKVAIYDRLLSTSALTAHVTAMYTAAP